MSPSAIAVKAAAAGLDAAALTDHNSALNCRAFKSCCEKNNIMPIFGMEVTSIEEAHILCLFETVEQAEELGSVIYDKLPDIPNKPEKFGDQVFVDTEDNIIGEVEKYLINAAGLTLDELFDHVMDLGGMFIPAHIDKPVFSIPSQLGFLPDMEYTALETTQIPCPVDTGAHSLIMNSDAHYIDDIAVHSTVFDTGELTFSSLKKAIAEDKICLF